MQIVDLTVPLNQDTPVYPGDPATKIEPAGVLAKDGYTDHYISLGTHVGTHVDAPSHMLDDGQTLNQIPTHQFVGQGKYLRVKGSLDTDQLESLALGPEDILILDYGMADKYHDQVYFEDYPAMPESVAKYLVDKKIKLVGMDVCSVDHEEFVAHRTLLAGGVLILENLTNLKGLEGQAFKIYALPLKLELDGAPARVIAVIE